MGDERSGDVHVDDAELSGESGPGGSLGPYFPPNGGHHPPGCGRHPHVCEEKLEPSTHPRKIPECLSLSIG